MKKLVLVLVLGFVTYVVHGGINDFLDTDKASVPFWGFISMLVAIDIYHRKKNKKEIEPKPVPKELESVDLQAK